MLVCMQKEDGNPTFSNKPCFLHLWVRIFCQVSHLLWQVLEGAAIQKFPLLQLRACCKGISQWSLVDPRFSSVLDVFCCNTSENPGCSTGQESVPAGTVLLCHLATESLPKSSAMDMLGVYSHHIGLSKCEQRFCLTTLYNTSWALLLGTQVLGAQ